MAEAHHNTAPVPADMVKEHRAGWNFFTKAVVVTSGAVVVFLLAMLLVFKVF